MEKQRTIKKWLITIVVVGIIVYCAAGIDYSGLASFFTVHGKGCNKRSVCTEMELFL